MTCTLFDGQRLRVVVPEIVGSALRREGCIEAGLTRALLDRLQPGSTFVDVGAHYGYFSVLAARRVWPSGSVVAFEPARRTAGLLRRNTAHFDNVTVEEVAVQDAEGTAVLRDYGVHHSAVNTVLPGARIPVDERRRLRADSYRVPAVSLDAYAARTGVRPDVVKIDAEGAELAILCGMRSLLASAAPLVALETGDYDGMVSPPTAESVDLLTGLGYRAHDVGPDGGLRPHERHADGYGYGNLVFLP